MDRSSNFFFFYYSKYF